MSGTEILTLKGLSPKGKNRVRELGERWIVLLYRDNVSFNPMRLPGGGWLLIAPMNDTEKVRWIARDFDKDFKIKKSELIED